MSDYEPISCALHDQYEIAIMHKTALRLQWQDDSGGMHKARVLPLDIRTEQGAEYLLVRRLDDEETLRLRLDKVRML